MSNEKMSGSPCGACKFLRRKCVRGCVFAPFFTTDDGAPQFAAVHKVFGASNVAKMLQSIPNLSDRQDAVMTICYEAQARLRDLVYGCVSQIVALQHQVELLQTELAGMYSQMATKIQKPTPQCPGLVSAASSSTSSLSNGDLQYVYNNNNNQQQYLTALHHMYANNTGTHCQWRDFNHTLNANGSIPSLSSSSSSSISMDMDMSPTHYNVDAFDGAWDSCKDNPQHEEDLLAHAFMLRR